MAENLSDIWKLKQRGKRDSQRHEELVKRAIKKHGRDVITEYNIIKSNGKKKVKIPIRFLDKYHFKYGKLNNDSGVGQGQDVKEGAEYRKRKMDQQQNGNQPGDGEGDVAFNAEISIDELVDILLEELNLPWMEPNKSSKFEIVNEEFTSVSKKGIMPDLDIKRTLLANIKRNAALGEAKVGDFSNEDLRYKVWEEEKEYVSNAVVYLMMDRSGSMDKEKTYIAKSFYFWMVQFLKKRYKNIDLVFVGHDAKAFEMTEEEFFGVNTNGGTKCSSAFEFAYKHIKSNYDPEDWNIYVFEFSDGDNWGTDNDLCIEWVRELLPMCRAIGYGEVIPDSVAKNMFGWVRKEEDTLFYLFNKRIKRTRFVPIKLKSREDVFYALKKFFNVGNISKQIEKR